MLRRVGDARRNDDPAIAAVEVGAFDRAVVGRGTGAHIRPVDVSGLDIDRHAIRKLTVRDDELPVGAVWPHRVDAAGAHFQKKQSPDAVSRADVSPALFPTAAIMLCSCLRGVAGCLSSLGRSSGI